MFPYLDSTSPETRSQRITDKYILQKVTFVRLTLRHSYEIFEFYFEMLGIYEHFLFINSSILN